MKLSIISFIPFISFFSATARELTNSTLELTSASARIRFGDGPCFTKAEMADQAAVDTIRKSNIEYMKKTGYFGDARPLQVWKLDKGGRKSLRACADMCVLDWRLDSQGDPLDTDCSTDAICGMKAGTIVPSRACEAFTFNTKNKECILYDGDTSLNSIKKGNKKFKSGLVICDTFASDDDWAATVN